MIIIFRGLGSLVRAAGGLGFTVFVDGSLCRVISSHLRIERVESVFLDLLEPLPVRGA